ncbi:hypothetical protein E2C01_060951 [Portunus trituberculatus]|uniref:Uncharacterized protein n=1 Tax=Portunus trituberculatus TaxID=210409 RepID=A0A5B7HD21_PORTR|nr:hypothetical protein [Portunus trituberculatus]
MCRLCVLNIGQQSRRVGGHGYSGAGEVRLTESSADGADQVGKHSTENRDSRRPSACRDGC